MCIASVNWKLDLLVSIPILLISTVLEQQASLSADNDNMSCYVLPETQANRMSLRWTVNLVCMVMVAYVFRYMNLKRFLE